MWLTAGYIVLHLGVEAAFVPARKAHPAFTCSGYIALLERLRANGVAVAHDPLPFNGHAHCYIADPFGNRIELIDTA